MRRIVSIFIGPLVVASAHAYRCGAAPAKRSFSAFVSCFGGGAGGLPLRNASVICAA
jgi:hypothetical protein